MKKLFLIAAAGLFFATTGNAQVQRQTPQHRHMQSDSTRHFKRGEMMQQLNLSDDQKSQMKTLNETMQQQKNAIQNDANLTADQKKEKMKELHQSRMEKVNAVLTPEQQAKMKSFRQKGKQNHEMHKGANQKMHQLDLTADQKTQMKSLHQSMQQQRNAVKNDAGLSADQKKEKMKDLRKTQMEKMNTILTPEQQAKMKEWREQRKKNHPMHKMDNQMNQSEQS